MTVLHLVDLMVGLGSALCLAVGLLTDTINGKELCLLVGVCALSTFLPCIAHF